MTNAELIKALRYCAEHEGCDYYIAKDCPREDTWVCGADCEQILMIDAADALEADEQRIDGLQKLVDINTERCEALRKQLREAHENYEKHLNELTTKCNQLQAAVDNYEKRIAELMPKEGEYEEKKPKTVRGTGYSFYCDCPTCGGRLIRNVDGEWCAGSFDRFCRMCGQKIDWSEYCGWSNKPFCAKMKGENDGES